jgi:Domain of unknown function (DUF5911)
VSDAGNYAPIHDYGLIGDCRTAALVSRGGSIDWWCVPRFDSGSCFGRLLDHERGGHCTIAPTDTDGPAFQGYADHTLVLETIFRGPAGEACVIDCLALPEGGPDAEPARSGSRRRTTTSRCRSRAIGCCRCSTRHPPTRSSSQTGSRARPRSRPSPRIGPHTSCRSSPTVSPRGPKWSADPAKELALIRTFATLPGAIS